MSGPGITDRPTESVRRRGRMTLATLFAFSDEARYALGGRDTLAIYQLPFKVGRECRSGSGVGRLAALVERRLRNVPQLNDCYLFEVPSGAGFHISREHFVIDEFDGVFFVTDRGSACGTRINEMMLGSDSKDIRAEIRDRDIITVGSADSPYVFEFRLGPA